MVVKREYIGCRQALIVGNSEAQHIKALLMLWLTNGEAARGNDRFTPDEKRFMIYLRCERRIVARIKQSLSGWSI